MNKNKDSNQEEKQRINDRKEDELTKNKSKKLFIAGIGIIAVIVLVFFGYIQPKVIKPMKEYNYAIEQLEKGNIAEAQKVFTSLGDYKDSVQQIENCEIARADNQLAGGNYELALIKYEQFKDNANVTEEKINKCKQGIYQDAIKLLESGDAEKAKKNFEIISDYSDSKAYIEKCDQAIQKEKEEAEKAAKEAEAKRVAEEAKKAAEEQKKMEESPLIGTWYAREVYNYLDTDMTDQMGDLSTYYFTFKSDGTGTCSMGSHEGKKDFTWKLQEGSNGAIGTWTLKGNTDKIFYYGDHILMYTDKMDAIWFDMRFFCYK